MASSSSPPLPNFKHDVFVNYWPEDTGNNFTSHLKKTLTGAGFNVAMNDMIGEGKEISDTLLSQISESLISVVIFSKNYANSSDCLDELVKIIESQKENGRHVLPVFLGVEPSDVRKQTGAFGDGFHELIQSKQFMEKKETWRSALMKTANLSGWHSAENISEAKIVEGIVERIMKILDELPSRNFSNGFVGNYQVEAVESILGLQSNTNVQILGIWGMAGIGKTRISKEVFNRISSRFEVSCFLAYVTRMLKTGGMQSLTKEMFSELGIDCNSWRSRYARRALNNRRVLIILDDVSNFPGLKSFVQECQSYGRGSIVVLTSRDEQVLKSYQCEYIYEVKKLNHCESSKLFGYHASKKQTCQEMYGILLNKALSYCGGLPLALEVMGCDLCGKNFKEWESMLAKLENIPNPTVHEVIKISYEELDRSEKDIFLDIACVFHGWNEATIKRILDASKLHAVIGISRLLDKALITNWGGILTMHDLIQQCGQDIVLQECIEEPGNRSRMWRFKDFAHVVEQNTGSEKVEFISVDLSKATKYIYMMPEFFDKMPRLRVLDLHDFLGKPSGGIKLHLPKGLRSLSNKLRYLRWDCYPLTSFPEKVPNHLVELRLRGSKVKQLWSEGVEPHLPMLECMDLSKSNDLIKLPDFSKTPNLRTLEAVGCASLIEIPSSIQHLSKLQSLQMGCCTNLSKLPELPQSIVSLNFKRNKIKELPSSIAFLSQLEILQLEGCKNLKSLPDLPSSLESLDVNGCTSLKIEGDYIFGSSLKDIHLGGNDLESLPASIKHLSQLQELELSYCKNLKCLPDLPSSLEKLYASGCTSLKIEGDYIFGSSLKYIYLSETELESLPASIKHLSQLRMLRLGYCENLKSLPDLPSSLSKLYADGCTSLKIEGDYIFGLSLIRIKLSETDLESLPASIKHLSQLEMLHLRDCKNLKCLPDLPSSLEELYANGCTSLKIEDNYIFGSSLIDIYLSETDLESLPASIKHLSKLEMLQLRDCKNLKSLPDLPSSLQVLDVEGCTSLTTVGNFFGEDHCERHLKFNLGGCFNLDQNFRIRSLVNAPQILKSMELCIPASEVPDWFKYKEDGSSINVKMLGGTLLDLSKLAFCIVIEDFSNIINKKKISSHFKGMLEAECNCLFVTELGEQRGASRSFMRFDDFHIKSEHVLLWTGPDRGYDDKEVGILSSPLPLVRFSEAKFEFRAHIKTYDIHMEDDEKMECKIKQCGFSQVGGVWETHKREIRQREYEEEEEPSSKRLKCGQPPVTPTYN